MNGQEPTGNTEPSVQNTDSARSVLALDKYEFMSDAYFGTRGFRDGSYLVPHDREVFYLSRRKNSFYKNFTKPIVNATVDPVFNRELARQVRTPAGDEITGEPVNAFSKNCDGAGTGLTEFMRGASLFAQLHGVSFIVMDNFEAGELPASADAELRERKFPYVYLRKANHVAASKTDRFGRLISITFEEAAPVSVTAKAADRQVPVAGGDSAPKFRRRWTAEAVELLARSDKGEHEWVVVLEYANPIGAIPVVMLFSSAGRDEQNKILVDPPAYDIARINHAIFNKDSEVREQERAQGFSIFYFQTDATGSISLGAKNVLFVDPTATMPPGFASPDPAILAGLVSNNEALRSDLFQVAGQNGVKGVQTSKSGVAMQWEFFAHESVLRKVAAAAAEAERKVFGLFGLYMGQEYSVASDYPTDFAPGDIAAEAAVLTDVIERVAWPARALSAIKAKLFRLLTPEADESVVSVAVEEIEQEGVDASQPRE